MKILIVSFFNSSNYGDCYLSNALFEHYSNKYDSAKISYTMDPFTYMDVSNLKDIQINKKSDKKDIMLDFISMLHLNRGLYIYYKKKKIFSNDVQERVIEVIKESDLVILGGGNMVFDLTEKTLSAARLQHFVDLCHKFGKKTFVCSIGIGPFANNKQYLECIKVLENVDAVSFRDPISYELYENKTKKSNGYLSTDVAFWKNVNVGYQNWKKREEVIGVNVIAPSLFVENYSEIPWIEQHYINLINKLLEENLKRKIVIFTTELRDNIFAKQIFDKLNSNRTYLKCLKNEDELKKLYDNLKVIISSRMHSAIIAFNNGVPAIGLAWQQKLYGLFNSLDMQKLVFDFYQYKEDTINLLVKKLLEFDKEQYDAFQKQIADYVNEKLNCNDMI